MRIAVDAMGGDHGPRVVVPGVLRALAEMQPKISVVLLGDEAAIQKRLADQPSSERLDIIHAPEVISVADSPATAIRRKPQSSLAVGCKLLRSHEVDAFVSAGSTGAVVAGALLSLGRIGRVRRPAIATRFPTEKGRCIFLDAGATSDCKPNHLLQFAAMGAVYARLALGLESPRVGLLNIGEEDSKGNELAVETHRLLTESKLQFVGNVEGRDVLSHRADVVVCDGFVGNIVLKFGESMLRFLSRQIRREVGASMRAKAGALFLQPVFEKLRKRIDYQEEGGAPLLGVDGIVIIAHGKSSERAIANAVLTSASLVENRLIEKTRTLLEEMQTAPT